MRKPGGAANSRARVSLSLVAFAFVLPACLTGEVERDSSVSDETDRNGTQASATPTPQPDRNDIGSYVTTDASDPQLHPRCMGLFNLCLSNPVDKALGLFGREDSRYEGADPGSITRQWKVRGAFITIDADNVGSITGISVSVPEEKLHRLRVSLPRRLVLGSASMGDVVGRMGSAHESDVFVAENTWFYSYIYRTGPEGSVVFDFGHSNFGGEVPSGDLDRRPVTSFSVGYPTY